MWAMLYDGGSHALWFYPFKGSSSTEIFTGANTVPANTWTQIEVQYKASAGGGAALLINGQTQAAWGVDGDYTRSTNLQRLQLWDDAADTSDFDDVTIATPSSTQATAPSAPTGVSGVAGNASVSLSWTAPPSDGGSPITSYRITPYIGTTAQTAINTGTTATTRTVTGLTNGTAYTFKVAATNAVGTGADSTASAAITPTAAQTAPGAPTAVSGTAGDASVALSWTAPASNGGSAITSYRITPYIGTTAQTAINTGTTATTRTVTGLTNGTAYTFKVAATNAVGTGADSAASAALTPQAVTAPGAPTAVSGTAGDASVALSWTAPASNGGSAITSYRITPYIGTTAQTAINTGTTATTRTVTGLTNGTAYTFKVAATNAVGTGADSAASAALTPQAVTAPGAPTAVSGTAGNTTVALSWTAPASNGGSAITSYRITPYIGTTAQTAINTGTTATTRTVTGLTNGTAYTFKVAATNAVGTGADSAASAAITPVTPPPAKTVVSIEFDDNIATQFQTLAVLQAHGMRATFYMNSGLTPDDIEWRMSWSQMLQLSAAGMEVGGHSWDHADLTLPGTNLHHEICDDRTNIQAHGLPLPTDFAYPYGADEASGVPAAVAACGYTTGRIVGGIKSSICPTGCPYAESIPPLDPYQTRTAPDVRINDSLATVEAYVTQAEQNGGGWVQLVFHDLCSTGCAGDDYSTTPTLFKALLDWLQPRAANGTVVKTVAQVMSGG